MRRGLPQVFISDNGFNAAAKLCSTLKSQKDVQQDALGLSESSTLKKSMLGKIL